MNVWDLYLWFGFPLLLLLLLIYFIRNKYLIRSCCAFDTFIVILTISKQLLLHIPTAYNDTLL